MVDKGISNEFVLKELKWMCVLGTQGHRTCDIPQSQSPTLTETRAVQRDALPLGLGQAPPDGEETRVSVYWSHRVQTVTTDALMQGPPQKNLQLPEAERGAPMCLLPA